MYFNAMLEQTCKIFRALSALEAKKSGAETFKY